MKKLSTIFLCGLLCVALAACGDDISATAKDPVAPTTQSNAEKDASSTEDAAKEAPKEVPATTPVVAKSLEASGSLGDYAVEIHDSQMATDYSGAPAIIISYAFTNNGEKDTSGMLALSQCAYQNGVQLDTAIIMDGNLLNSEDQMKDIKTGATIELKSAFLLTSDTAPVEFELSELISFSDDALGKTFEIAAGGVTVLSTAPTGDTSGTVGDYNVAIVSHALSKDYEGKSAIVVNLGFTNNSDSTANFITTTDCSAFQDGVELETAIITSADSDSSTSQVRNVKAGAGIPVSVAFILSSETSPVELEIAEFMSLSDETITTTINLAS